MIRDTISGDYDRAALAKLKFPIAWSGTTHAGDRAAEEAAISDLVDEAREALDADPDAIAVSIVDGVVTATVHDSAE